MKCEDYERLIHLSRPGERTEREEEELTRHLQVCGRCAQLHQQMSRAGDYIDRLKSVTPAVPHPEGLTDRIVAAIGAAQLTPARAQSLPELLYAFLMRPSVRYAYVAAVSLAVSLFLYQLVSLVSSLHALEQRMEQDVRPRPRAAVTYTVDRESLRRTGAMELLQPVLGSDDYSLSNGDVVVRKRSLEAYAAKTDVRKLRRLVSTYGLDMPEARIESLLDELKSSAVVQLRLYAEGG
ncbi:MAG: hypothetical protein WBH55_11430 [Bacteroidota bacterium]